MHPQDDRLDPPFIIFTSFNGFQLNRFRVWTSDLERWEIIRFTIDHYVSAKSRQNGLTVDLVVEFQSFSLDLARRELTLMGYYRKVNLVITLVRLWVWGSWCSDQRQPTSSAECLPV